MRVKLPWKHVSKLPLSILLCRLLSLVGEVQHPPQAKNVWLSGIGRKPPEGPHMVPHSACKALVTAMRRLNSGECLLHQGIISACAAILAVCAVIIARCSN